ncbi:hypothetical protein SAMN05428939_7840 [Streptomyces sp. TLI_105]|nr:hypothetical protein SAMN05428939_7840 [Streptomyces sp. TLI_105]
MASPQDLSQNPKHTVENRHTVQAVGEATRTGQPVAWPAPPCQYQVVPSIHLPLATESVPPPPVGPPAPVMLAGYLTHFVSRARRAVHLGMPG